MQKKKWKKPEMTILVRGKLEENVLRVCKKPGGGNPVGSCTPQNVYQPGGGQAYAPSSS